MVYGRYVSLEAECDHVTVTRQRCLDGTVRACRVCDDVVLQIVIPSRGTLGSGGTVYPADGPIDCDALACPPDDGSRAVEHLNQRFADERFLVVDDRAVKIFRTARACEEDVASRSLE